MYKIYWCLWGIWSPSKYHNRYYPVIEELWGLFCLWKRYVSRCTQSKKTIYLELLIPATNYVFGGQRFGVWTWIWHLNDCSGQSIIIIPYPGIETPFRISSCGIGLGSLGWCVLSNNFPCIPFIVAVYRSIIAFPRSSHTLSILWHSKSPTLWLR